jgi:putative endonuclease|tara:strand:- start:53518 stop:53901 length:384 start_codon:yes stop_codon:yes gene_type:complete
VSKNTKEVGNIGENVACKFLVKQRFTVIERNYTKKWGEIDIVAKKEGKWHFVEVKAVTRETLENVSREMDYAPEEKVHPKKLEKIARTAETYLIEKGIEENWCIDVIAVFLDMTRKQAKCRLVENVL